MNVDAELARFELTLKEYNRINQRLVSAVPASCTLIAELVAIRMDVKARSTTEKRQCRCAIAALTSVSAAARATTRLTELQAGEFRTLLDGAKRAQDAQDAQDRVELCCGVLGADLSSSKASSATLQEAAQDLEEAEYRGNAAAEVLVCDAQHLQGSSTALAGVQGELQLARKLLMQVMKSLYTDKIFMLFVVLVASVVASIVAYAALYKWRL